MEIHFHLNIFFFHFIIFYGKSLCCIFSPSINKPQISIPQENIKANTETLKQTKAQNKETGNYVAIKEIDREGIE